MANANRVTQFTTLLDGVDAEYGYDSGGQLTSVDHVGTSLDEAYDYDFNGNRTDDITNSAGTFDYETGPYNRLENDGIYAYQYDAEGNRTRRIDPATGEYTAYQWDHRNRLVLALDYDDSGTPEDDTDDTVVRTVTNVYDPLNQLVRNIVTTNPGGTVKTAFYYDDGQVVLQQNRNTVGAVTAGDLSHRYLWGDAVDQLLADEQIDWSDTDADGEVLWAITDNLGSVRDVLDSNGDLRVHRVFDAFGNVVSETHYNTAGSTVTSGQTGYVDEAFAFTGRWYDQATGLQNNLNRWYDPKTGRWPSEDPIGLGPDVNPFRYVGNGPTIWVDPDGLDRSGRPNPPPDFQPGDPNDYPPRYKQRCDALAKSIANTIKQIKERIEDIRQDKWGLPGHAPGLARRHSKEGHWDILNDLKRRLAQDIEEYNSKCRQPCPQTTPSPAPEPIPTPTIPPVSPVPIIGVPVPSRPPWYIQLPRTILRLPLMICPTYLYERPSAGHPIST
jgi:RHS repeat-associated protein